jgi:Mce-associated membrane protein
VAGRRNRPAGSTDSDVAAEQTQQLDAVPAEPETPEQPDDPPAAVSGDLLDDTVEKTEAPEERAPAPVLMPTATPRPGAKAEPKVRRTTEGDRRPAGKRRATGTTRPASLAAAEESSAERARHAKAEPVVERSRASRHLSAAIVVGVVAVVLAGLAFWFRGEADNLTSGDSNTALTDPGQTSQAVGQIKDAIEKTFSYNYTDLESTQRSVETLLTGKARCEYDLLFKALKEQAPAQQSVLATTVRDIALVRLEGDRAEALVFIDQSSTRADVNNSASVGAQFGVQAEKQDDQWKITQFNMFGQPLVDGKPVPEC